VFRGFLRIAEFGAYRIQIDVGHRRQYHRLIQKHLAPDTCKEDACKGRFWEGRFKTAASKHILRADSRLKIQSWQSREMMDFTSRINQSIPLELSHNYSAHIPG